DNKYILTSDFDGKVLRFDAETFDFVQMIKPPGTIPVSGIQMIKQDSVLLMSQSYPVGIRPELDSLLLMSMPNGNLFSTHRLSFQIINLDVDDHFGVLSYDNDY